MPVRLLQQRQQQQERTVLMLHLHTPTSTLIPHSPLPAATLQPHPPVPHLLPATPMPAAGASGTAAASNKPHTDRWCPLATHPTPQTTHKSTGAGTTPVAARDTTRRNQSLIPIPRRVCCCGSARRTAAAVAPSLPYASSWLLAHTFPSLSFLPPPFHPLLPHLPHQQPTTPHPNNLPPVPAPPPTS